MKAFNLNRLSIFVFFLIFLYAWFEIQKVSPADAGWYYYLFPLCLLGIWGYFGENISSKYPFFLIRFALCCAVVGILLRCYWTFFAGVLQTSDAAFYVNQGRDILAGKYFLFPYKQAGPGIMTAIGMFFGGDSERSALIPYILANISHLPLIYLLGRKLFGKVAGAFSLIIVSLWPEHIFYSSFITAHIYQSFFILLGVVLSLASPSNQRLKAWILIISGVCLGASQYMRGSSLIFLVGFLGFWILAGGKIKAPALVLSGFGLAILPIVYFNYSQLGILSVSPSQNSGMSMLIGTNLATRGHYYESFPQEAEKKYFEMQQSGLFPPGPADQTKLNQAATALALERIRQAPMEQFKNAIEYKFPVFWDTSANLFWALDNTFVSKNPNMQAEIVVRNEKLHRVLMLFCLLSLGLFVILNNRIINSLNYTMFVSFLWGCLALGSVHMLAEIQSQYHLAVAGFFPLLAGTAFANMTSLQKELVIFFGKKREHST